uniref:Class I SAM-dependent methyltransferase n=1 Tax=Desulfobacca acetoxidans TaxID=60893 RepID=A0A7V4LC70_9BACT
MSKPLRERWKEFRGALKRALSPEALRRRWQSREAVFTAIYRRKQWRSRESASGIGSELVWTAAVRRALPEIIRQTGTRTLLDAACGDFHWFKEMDLDLEAYIGGDIVPELIAENQRRYGDARHCFRKLDLTRDPLPRVDMILCRDCLVHLSFADIFAALGNIAASGSTYLLTTTFPRLQQNRDIITGDWRPLNLELPPFNFPEPLLLINEGYTRGGERYADKSLALWAVADLPRRGEGV